MSTSIVATAVALTESGILVNGLCVTDLLSGYEVRCADSETDGDIDGSAGAPVFRGSGVPVRRLEAVRELVEEVLQARADDPELTSANPLVPRTVFPWGIGADTTDILVAGPDKDATAAYLCMTGVRARTVDVSRALRLAGDLAEARAEVAATASPSVQASPDDEPDRDEDMPHIIADGDRGGGTLSRRVRVLAAVSVTLVCLVAGVVALRSTGAGQASGTATGIQLEEGEESPEEKPDQGDSGWRELSAGDSPAGEGAGDPVAAVTVDVAGWRMTESTSDSEIWTSGDAGMRVLVAARPTPVGTQGELDAAMLGALDGLDGNGDIAVTNRSPVAYEEYFPDSTTSWQVRLVDGHQVSVGCQYREVSDERRETCERFNATARVTAATG